MNFSISGAKKRGSRLDIRQDFHAFLDFSLKGTILCYFFFESLIALPTVLFQAARVTSPGTIPPASIRKGLDMRCT